MENSVDDITMVGVKARPRATDLAMEDNSSSPSKKIKVMTPSCNSPVRRSNFDSTAAIAVEVEKDYEEAANCCSSSEVITTITTSSSSDFLASCCSSNQNDDHLRKNDVVKDPCIADPEVESGETSSRYNDCHTTTTREEKEKDSEEATKSNGEDHTLGKSTVQIKRMPSDSEIEEFFAAAHRDIHKRFIDKYNFDIVKDIPLEGRYEWVQIKP